MTNGAKVGLWVAGLSIAGLSGYLIFLKLTALKTTRDAELAAESSTTTLNQTAPKQIVAPVAPPKQTGFATAPAVLKIGTKIFAGPKNANAYKTALASATNIYKYYPAASYIGTYLGKDGLFSKVIVEESGFFSNSSKTVWVPTSDIKF